MLVESVKGYAAHERSDVRERHRGPQRGDRRAGASTTRGGRGHARSGDAIGCSSSPRPTPSSRRARNFSQLQTDLREAEDQIAITRRVYNDTVETYNTLIQVFPAVIVARLFGFRRREFFDAPAEAEATPQVEPLPRPGAMIARRLTAALAAIVAALVLAAPAAAESADITDADVALRLARTATCW